MRKRLIKEAGIRRRPLSATFDLDTAIHREMHRRPVRAARDDTLDAERFRALLATCHVLTDANGPYQNVAKDAKYLMVEFVSEKADPTMTQLPTDHLLLEYTDCLLQNERKRK
jgi:hypothetical protein